MEMANDGNDNASDATPKKEMHKRSSTEYMRAMASPSAGSHINERSSPETPSPPCHPRRSSTSLGYLTSPLHPRAEALLPKNELSPGGSNAGSRHNGLVLPNSPSMPRSSRLMPPTTPKSRNAEMFLSPPPKLKSPSVYKDNGKPIKEISNGLKARLNYALVKLQNGWIDKTLPELENEFKDHMPSEGLQRQRQQYRGLNESSPTHLRKPGFRGSYRNEYADDGDSAYLSSHSDEESSNGNSAHLAFLKALSSPKKTKNNAVPPSSPMDWSSKERRSRSPGFRDHKSRPTQLTSLKIPEKQQPPSEVEAIETLMSLSSPQKSQTLQEYNLPAPPSSSATQYRSGQPSPTASSSGPSSASGSASSEKSHGDKFPNPLIPHSYLHPQNQSQEQNRLVRPLIVPSLQRTPLASEPSSDSATSDKSDNSNNKNYLDYSQQQTDIETDVEDLDGNF